MLQIRKICYKSIVHYEHKALGSDRPKTTFRTDFKNVSALIMTLGVEKPGQNGGDYGELSL